MNKTLYWILLFAFLISSCSIEVNQPVAIAPTPSPESSPATASTSSFPITHTPVLWADLNLTGKLVYLSSTTEGTNLIANIQILNLVTGDISTVFSAPAGAWVYYLTVSPD